MRDIRTEDAREINLELDDEMNRSMLRAAKHSKACERDSSAETELEVKIEFPRYPPSRSSVREKVKGEKRVTKSCENEARTI